MAILTAKQLKDRESPEFAIDIGKGDSVWARVPDIQLLVLQGIMPTPLLGAVVKMIGAWVGTPISELTEDIISSNAQVLAFTNIMVTASLLKPKVVMTDADKIDDDTLLVTDLTLATRKEILIAVTNRIAAPAVVAAATEFPGEPAREGVGQDVPAVPAAAV